MHLYFLHCPSSTFNAYWPENPFQLWLSGFYSWRNPDNGSWFIQAICEEFNIHGRTLDLLTLMTFVNRRVAINYQSCVPQRKSFHRKKQIPTIVSMLTRIVRFPKKSILRSKPVIHSVTEENKTSNIENKTYVAAPSSRLQSSKLHRWHSLLFSFPAFHLQLQYARFIYACSFLSFCIRT